MNMNERPAEMISFSDELRGEVGWLVVVWWNMYQCVDKGGILLAG